MKQAIGIGTPKAKRDKIPPICSSIVPLACERGDEFDALSMDEAGGAVALPCRGAMRAKCDGATRQNANGRCRNPLSGKAGGAP